MDVDKPTNESLKELVENLTQKSPIQIVQERKLKFFGHVTRHPYEFRHDGQANMYTIMHGSDEFLEIEGVVGHREAVWWTSVDGHRVHRHKLPRMLRAESFYNN